MSDVKPVIYQLVVRYFGNTNTTRKKNGTLRENGSGKFADINDAALASLREMGVTHVWLTGVLRQATLTDWSEIGLPPDDPDVVKGIAGSFYAVRDYFDVCPDYAIDPRRRLEEFDALIARIHAAGMKALIDLVPNHVARGYESVIRPDLNFGNGDDQTKFFDPQNHFFYLAASAGQPLRLSKPPHWAPEGFVFDGRFEREDGSPGRTPKATGNNNTSPAPSDTDWYETIKLNYGYDFVERRGVYDPRPRTWDVVDQIIAYWQARGVDGFRCDFAHYVPPEAWTYLIAQARQRDPRVYFFAEAYPWQGSGDPITDRHQLIDCGFDAIYHDESYNKLKRIYQGTGSQEDYNTTMVSFSPFARAHCVEYLENHDERRIASPVDPYTGWGESGFGSMEAGYLLAPLQYLVGPGPVLMLNGQEVGEPGADDEGFSGPNGRTTLFDYWSMPEFVKWVNNHAYDGGGLSDEQKQLRRFYAALFAICQHPLVRADGYWGLKYYNNPSRFADCPSDLYTFARYIDHGQQALVVVGNFNRHCPVRGTVRLPTELVRQTGLSAQLKVHLVLDRGGTKEELVALSDRRSIIDRGFSVMVPPETTQVYLIA